MAERSTWGEASEPEAEPVAILTLVLSFEDLVTVPRMSARVSGSKLTIGRAADGETEPSADDRQLCLPDNWVSSQHATVHSKGGGAYFLEDGGSRNGTWVNGQRLEGRQRIFDGDLLEIGHTLLCFRIGAADVLEPVVDGGFELGPTSTRCPELASLVRDLRRIAPTKQPVMLLGETGTGKDVVARALHVWSGRTGELCTVDCGAVPDSLFESTFFGHRRGSFTGATEPRDGEIVRADGGTLFLDEVANLSAPCQAKLLRAVEEASVTPLGTTQAQAVDVRWIAATNAEPFRQTAQFRPDLLRRLAGFTARLPPLRRRRDDLGALTAWFLRELGVDKASITAAAGRKLFADTFRGNVRQLRSAIQSAAVLADGAPIGVAHLPVEGDGSNDDDEPAPRTAPPSSAPPPPRVASKPLAIAPDPSSVEDALARTGGNVVRAAALLDVRPRQLYRWIERFAVPLDKYR